MRPVCLLWAVLLFAGSVFAGARLGGGSTAGDGPARALASSAAAGSQSGAHQAGASGHQGGAAGAAPHSRRNYQDSVVDIYRELYKQFHTGLKAARQRVKEFVATNGTAQYMDIEAEITYLRLRYARPEVVWEISPNSGCSTLYILSALMDNNKGHLWSFDVHENSLGNKQITADMRTRWTFILGDMMVETQKMTDNFPDYLFLDSWHSYKFGKFYTDQLLPQLTKHTYVSHHDVYYVAEWFWSDDTKEEHGWYYRDKECYPLWMPNEEGIVEIDWLMFQEHACNVFSLSNKRHNETFRSWMAMREPVMGSNADGVTWPFAVDHENAFNPSLFFELNCDVKIHS